MPSHQSILIHIGPLNLLGFAACQNHGASQHVKVLLTKHRDTWQAAAWKQPTTSGFWEKAEQTNEHRCFYRTSECHKENEQTGIICIRGTRQTHLGVNPYSADGTDLEIVTWQAAKKKRQPARERERERERTRLEMCERFFQKKKKKSTTLEWCS